MIQCENLVRIYKVADLEVVALQGLDLTVESGELMGIIGNSGSGKSTLLNMLGGLDRPSAGKLFVDGKDLFRLSTAELVAYKLKTVGFVWQNNARNLIPYLTAQQNVELPMLLSGKGKREWADELLEMVGFSDRKHNQLNQLSGGEQQRVAIAIALANRPKLLLADEPTGSVDTKTAGIILDIFQALNRSLGLTVVIVTHDLELAKKVDRVVSIRDGKTSSEFLRRRSGDEAATAAEEQDGSQPEPEGTHEERRYWTMRDDCKSRVNFSRRLELERMRTRSGWSWRTGGSYCEHLVDGANNREGDATGISFCHVILNNRCQIDFFRS